jgi:hypothetical protein
MLVTHKRLLEWSPSGDPDRNSRNSRKGSLAGVCRTMWIAPLIVTAAVLYLALLRPVALAVAGPVLALWFASPVIAWWISRPLTRRQARLMADQIIFLRKLSRLKSFLHRLPRTPCIRLLVISLFRPRSSASSGRSSAPAGPAPLKSIRHGCFT